MFWWVVLCAMHTLAWIVRNGWGPACAMWCEGVVPLDSDTVQMMGWYLDQVPAHHRV
jgi:hypothetical protein